MADPPSSRVDRISNFQELYNSPSFSDVTIVVSEYPNRTGKELEIHAHKAILAANSRTLSSLFERNANVDTVDLARICDCCSFDDFLEHDMEGVLKYLYGFPLEILETHDACPIIALYKCAHELGIPSLQETTNKLLERCLQKLVTDSSLHEKLIMIWDNAVGFDEDHTLQTSRDTLRKICCRNWKAINREPIVEKIQAIDCFFCEDILDCVAPNGNLL